MAAENSDYENSWKSNCVFAIMKTAENKPAVQPCSDQCYQLYTYRYVCLKEAGGSNVAPSGSSLVPQAVSSGGSYKASYASGAFFIACLLSTAVFFAFLAIKYYRNYRAVEENCGVKN